ncbi:MAG: TIGR01777 family oxidoreductase [Schleiferiaceae bacterium]|nr:TIGR01777 family oxidoreductase [Schleiferiaceae bacterium]
MIYCVTGGSGLVGRAVQKELEAQGHEVRILTRTPRKPGEFAWNPSAYIVDPAALHGVHGVIHLAGASVSERWTKSHKRAIMDSRIQGAETLYRAIEAMDQRPEVMVSASAVGIYPNSLDRVYSERDGGAVGFLGDVVRAWESQADRFADLGLRVAKLRIGIVLGHGGGVLGTLLPVFRLGLGSALGDGKHWMPWIHVDDLAGMVARLATDSALDGVWNGVGPESSTNKDFSLALAKVLKKPFWAPAPPAWALRLVLGEMAQIALMSTHCSAQKWKDLGFAYQFNELDAALKNLVG